MTLYWKISTPRCLYTIYDGSVYILRERYGPLFTEDPWQWKWTCTKLSDLQGHGFEMIGEL